MDFPHTDRCFRCIDRRIAQAACIMRVISSEPNYHEEKQAFEELLTRRTKLAEQHDKMTFTPADNAPIFEKHSASAENGLCCGG